MKNWILAAGFAVALMSGSAMAQVAPPNEMGVTMGHLHMNSKDIEANKKILVAMGGVAAKTGNFEIVKFPNAIVFLNQGPGAAPPVGGSVGTVVNHYGFLVPDVQAAMAKWKAAGVPVEPGGGGRKDQAFVTTPDGVTLRINWLNMAPTYTLPMPSTATPCRKENRAALPIPSATPLLPAWPARVLKV